MISSTPLVFYDGPSESSSYAPDLTSSPAVIRQRSESSDSLHAIRDAKRRRSDLNPLRFRPTPSPSPPDLADQWSRSTEAHFALPPSVVMRDVGDVDSLPAWTYQHPESVSLSPARLGLSSGLPTPESGDESCYSGSETRPSATRASTAPALSLTAKALALKASASHGLAGPQRELKAGGGTSVAPDVLGGASFRRSTAPSAEGILSDASTTKDRFVAGLVGASVIAIESIWGPQSPADTDGCPVDSSVLPLQFFVREVLRRSRTSCSTLQVALYYLHKSRREIREAVARADAGFDSIKARDADCVMAALTPEEMDAYPSPPHSPVDLQNERFAEAEFASKPNPILCGRRMFLASLIAASKFLQDRNYSNRAWAKISGLPVAEINKNERAFLALMNFQLHLRAEDFQKWTERLATLALQGAALESATCSPADVQPARRGLARHATEYPPAAPLRELRPAVVAPRVTGSTLGRSQSHPNVFSAGSAASLAVPPVSLQKRSTPLRQTVTPTDTPIVMSMTSPAPTDTSSSSSEASPRLEMSRRRVLPLPATARKIASEVPVAFARGRDGCSSAGVAGDTLAWVRAGVSAH